MRNNYKRRPIKRSVPQKQNNKDNTNFLFQEGNFKNRRNPKNIKDQYSTFLNKAKDAQNSGDDVLEHYFLQFAEHYFRLMNENGRTLLKSKQDSTELSDSSATEIQKTDFDDLTEQLN